MFSSPLLACHMTCGRELIQGSITVRFNRHSHVFSTSTAKLLTPQKAPHHHSVLLGAGHSRVGSVNSAKTVQILASRICSTFMSPPPTPCPQLKKQSCSLPLKVTRKMFECLLDKFDPTGKVNQINVR